MKRLVRRSSVVLATAVIAGASVTAPTQAAAPPPAPVTVWVASLQNSAAVPVNAGSGSVGQPVPVEDPQTVVITPNGRTALFTTSGTLALTPVDTVTRTVGQAMQVNTFGPMAVSPDGRTVWVGENWQMQAEIVQKVNLATRAVTPIGLGLGTAADVVLTPDGKTLFVSGRFEDNRVGVLPVNTATNQRGALIPFATVGAMTMTPNGRTLFVSTGSAVVPIDVATRAKKQAIAVAATDLAANPRGTTVDATTAQGLVSINVATRSVTAPIPGTAGALRVEVGPYGDRAFLRLNNDLVPVWLTTGRVGAPVGLATFNFAISPTQAPVAAFTADPGLHGMATRFDASGSAARSGQLASYAWRFGDGSTKVTTGPSVSHVYANAGSYSVSLTVTDSYGTSTTKVFTGHQVVRNGGPSARTARTITVG